MQKNRQAFRPRRQSEFVWAILFLAAAAGISPMAPSRAIAADEIQEATPTVAGDGLEVSHPLSPPVELPSSLGLTAPAMGVMGVTGGLGASVGVTRDSFSSAPAMLGDFFGGSFLDLDNQGIGSETTSINGGDRRFKVAENVSPMPRDRVFINDNHFENALQDHRGKSISLDRYTPGFEKTFFDK